GCAGVDRRNFGIESLDDPDRQERLLRSTCPARADGLRSRLLRHDRQRRPGRCPGGDPGVPAKAPAGLARSALWRFSMSRQSAFKRLADWLPGVRLLLQYDRSCLAPDLTAGLVVTLVLIPSAIAYADLARCSPASGLYAALGGMVAFALLTSSRH